MAIVRRLLGLGLVLVLLLWENPARAGTLADRLAQFPHWDGKPSAMVAEGDLIYPDWMEGTWNVTSTLVDQVAPLAPDLVTPGFESNRRYLNQPIDFSVRFQAADTASIAMSDHFVPIKPQTSESIQVLRPNETHTIVGDRAFNGLNIAKAYLGDRTVQAVKVDPNSPNRQITLLRSGRQLVSVVTGRATETPAPDRFIATEVSQQIFRGIPQPYFNEVETTTAYQLVRSPSLAIEADQVTAVYLSPQDPNYFKAQAQPVALYRYHLKLIKVHNF
ncbi:MAG TPA: hypothetical protein V6C95_05620 [Coleofasciculaceae cyanobacterium]